MAQQRISDLKEVTFAWENALNEPMTRQETLILHCKLVACVRPKDLTDAIITCLARSLERNSLAV
jgi:hypothetical protein